AESAKERFDVEVSPHVSRVYSSSWVIFWITCAVAAPVASLIVAFGNDGFKLDWICKFLAMIGGWAFGVWVISFTVWMFVRFIADEDDPVIHETGSGASKVMSLPIPFYKAKWRRHLESARSEQRGVKFFKWLEGGLVRLFKHEAFGKGWLRIRAVDGKADRLALEHRFVMAAFFVTLVLSFLFGWLSSLPERVAPDHLLAGIHFPTYLFLVFAVNLIFQGLSVLAYYFDYFRVPTLMIVVVFLIVLDLVPKLGTDQEFETKSIERVEALIAPEALLFDEMAPEIPIVITAEGGGIHAGAWAAHVLASLEMMCRHREKADGQEDLFSRSIVACSGVSGGSYGLMYWVDSYDQGSGAIPPRPLPQDEETLYRWVRGRAMRSSLDFAIRGLVYHDLPKIIPFNPFALNDRNRGYMLEKAWSRDFPVRESRLDSPGDDVEVLRRTVMLSEWEKDARNRIRPAVLFNSTSMEGGHPIVFATSEIENDDFKADRPPTWHYQSWWPGLDVPVVSAVRCSASFPYVTPATNPECISEPEKIHYLVDGGYFDNTGVMTMIRWLESGIEARSEEGWAKNSENSERVIEESGQSDRQAEESKKIILIRILESRAQNARAGTSGRMKEAIASENAGSGVIQDQESGEKDGLVKGKEQCPEEHKEGEIEKGAWFQLKAPPVGLLSVWAKGHRYVADRELERLKRWAAGRGVEIVQADFVFPVDPQKETKPLSWHLTREDMDEIARIRFDGKAFSKETEKPLHDLSTEQWSLVSGRQSTEVLPVWDEKGLRLERSSNSDYADLKAAADEVLRTLFPSSPKVN
ncbi:MAG: patatin-like phospholipase family protein, partial [Verrucomicrobiota bacterium]